MLFFMRALENITSPKPFLLITFPSLLLQSSQHLSRMAGLLTFSATASQHLGCMAGLLTFSATASQHLGCMAGLLTFSATASQHLSRMAVYADFFCFYRSTDRYFLYIRSIVLQYLSVVSICGTDGRI